MSSSRFRKVALALPGAVEGDDGSYAAVRLADDTSIRAPRALVAGHATVSVGVRPEKIRLHEEGHALPDGHNHMTGVVRDASYLGVSTQYQIEARGVNNADVLAAMRAVPREFFVPESVRSQAYEEKLPGSS